MNVKLEREVTFLKYALSALFILFIALLFFVLSGYGRNHRFGEIDVERINIVEKDGQLRMVISNKERQHPGISNGKIIKRAHPRPPGMIFFNQIGDEMGGLVFDENGGDGHFGSLTFDKVRGDQALGFRYLESDNGTYTAGMEVWQRPNIDSDSLQSLIEMTKAIKNETERNAVIERLREDGLLTTERLFVGKYRNNESVIVLSDVAGRPRISLSVAQDGRAAIDFLDEKGNVYYSLPDK